MKNFNIMGVCWKIRLLGGGGGGGGGGGEGVPEKPMTKTEREVGQFPDLRGACQKRGEGLDTLMRTMN